MDKSYKIFDSHAHYDDESFDEDREFLLNEIQENGVIGAINCSSSYESVKKTCEIIKKWPFIYGAVGIHPQNADELTDKALEEFRSIIKSNDKIVAVGEIGLDYYWDENPSKDIHNSSIPFCSDDVDRMHTADCSESVSRNKHTRGNRNFLRPIY